MARAAGERGSGLIPAVELGQVRGGGLYLLHLVLSDTRTLRIGCLGKQVFVPGHYLYIGSARSGLKQRVTRHLRTRKPRRWHIDNFREVSLLLEVLLFPGLGGREVECRLNADVQLLDNARVGPRGFGSSDCRCVSHLTCFPGRPNLAPLREKWPQVTYLLAELF